MALRLGMISGANSENKVINIVITSAKKKLNLLPRIFALIQRTKAPIKNEMTSDKRKVVIGIKELGNCLTYFLFVRRN